MDITYIKRFLLIGIFVSCIASIVEVFVANASISPIFFSISLIGHFIFLFALWRIDKAISSMLFRYYAGMIAISITLYFMQKFGGNEIIKMCLCLLFMVCMFLYLKSFSSVSNEPLFIYSFYIFIVSFIVGICILQFGSLVYNKAVVSFILGFIIFPSLIAYIVALFNLKSIGRLG